MKKRRKEARLIRRARRRTGLPFKWVGEPMEAQVLTTIIPGPSKVRTINLTFTKRDA